jgi:hypothetical protein
VDDNKFGVPAGWYPDPLGLPQLRWWDAMAWTEHTSEARAPIVIQPATRIGFADDELPTREEYEESLSDRAGYDGIVDGQRNYDGELPSRREQRERERRENGGYYEPEFLTETSGEQQELSAQPLLAMTLRELEPPLTDTVDDLTPDPKRAATHTNASTSIPALSDFAQEEMPQRAPKRMKTYTGAIWIIALMPVFTLVALLLLILVLGQGNNYPLVLTVLFAPYFLVIGFAAYDRLLLMTWGHKKPASALWALLTEPVYVIIRAMRTWRETGKGFLPIAVWSGTIGALLVGIVIFPGIAVAALPGAFADQAALSVESDALALQAKIKVSCPAPPVIIGDSFTCIRTSPNGKTDSIAVSLQRLNGWISWRVDDWGLTVMSRGK